MAAPPPAYTYQPINPQVAAQIENDDAEPDMDATHSPINIRISSPITVIGDENLIAIEPAEMASRMANAIIRSIRDCSMACAGIPMIDEEGRPRPIDVQVDAGITVRGNRNTTGGGAVLLGLRATRNLKRPMQQTDDDHEQSEIEGDDGEESEMDEGRKKQRVV